MYDNRLKPNPRVTRHAEDMAMERGGCKSREEANRWVRNNYVNSMIVYPSRNHPNQIRIQNDDMVLIYDPAANVIITAYISGHVKDRDSQ